MSWHFENTGTADEVSAAIDESVAMSGGMPATVGEYLKGAVASCNGGGTKAVISVRSIGHRPINLGSTETCEIKLVRSGPSAGR